MTDGRPHTDRTPWGAVLLLGALTAFGPISIDMYLPSLPAIGAAFHARPGAAQATLAAFFTGLAVGQIFYGPASDRWGRRWPLLGGVVLYVAASVWCALAPSLESLIAARFLQAIGGCAGQVIARAVVRDRFDHRQSARILSQLMLVMGLAPILAPFIGGEVAAVAGWRALFWILAAFGAFLGILVWFALHETRSPETALQAQSEHPARAYLTLLKSRPLVGFTLAAAFNSGALFAYITASPVLLISTYHIPPTSFGLVFGANAIGLIGMSQVNAHLLHRHAPETILRRGRPFSILFAGILALDAFTGWGGMWGVLAPLFLVLASFGLVGANAQACGLNVDPNRAGSISALMGGASFAVGALAASLTSVFTATWPAGGAGPMAAVILAAILASTAALYGIARPAPR